MTRHFSLHAVVFASSLLAASAAFAQLHPPSPETDMSAQQNSTSLMPNAPVGSQYPSHGNVQAGELNLNPTDPRAQMVNGLPNNDGNGGYGAPLAGNKANVPQQN
ncbi:hypothetical protein BVER_06235c [Candidatus Burkholderia verschuerenii]|uniref:Uncharacterized protein n=2 Tax=Candidatus Burkholderia verschuerenii TaxID=242163 RepID=A0A0L0MHD4_9BURK|nr:hypothetical protein BVER_06235c [Candidatus Burkholderia verschuerenii]